MEAVLIQDGLDGGLWWTSVTQRMRAMNDCAPFLRQEP